MLLYPEGLFERARVQKSVLVGSSIGDYDWGTLSLPTPTEHDDIAYASFRIVGESKKEIIRDLRELFGIDQENMFPDLEGYAQANAFTQEILVPEILEP